MDKCKKNPNKHMQSHLRQEDQELKLLSRFEAAWAVYFLKKKMYNFVYYVPLPSPTLFTSLCGESP